MHKKEVAFFVTCLVDQIYPEIGLAAVRLLRAAGYAPVVPPAQTCCGQPFFNSGLPDEAVPLARQTVTLLEPFTAVVVPSGSCTAFLRVEIPHLLRDDPQWAERAMGVARKTYELCQFLVHRAQWTPPRRSDAPPLTYHDSCHMNRLLGLGEEPRALLQAAGYTLREMAEADFCCGFGGLFSLRMAEVANAITEEKLRLARETNAPIVATADAGCLMQMRGLARRAGVQVEHVAVLLAAALDGGA